jgi:molybdate transport system substrate-binding protein
LIALVALALAPLGGVVHAAPARTGARAGGSLTVFAAASLTEAFTTIGAQFGAANGGAKVTFNFGGSDTLATQIVQGAPADVFASANTAQMNVVANAGMITGTPTTFVRNRLVVIVPKSNPGHVYSLPDLGRPGLKLVLAAPSVPVGKYARQAFQVMASDVTFGPNFLGRINANIVSEETDVKAVTSKVQLGEADAGVVYLTDVTPKVAPDVQEIPIPGPFNQVATYPIAVLKGSQDPALAQKFADYVLSPAGQAVLAKDGFITHGPPGGFAPALQVTGLVSKTLTLGVADLQKFPATSVKVTLHTDKATLGTFTYTGALLYDVVQAAIPISNTSYKNDPLRMFVTVHATDNYQVTVGMAEILPTFGHQKIILAYAKNGQPLGKDEGAVRLIVPGDSLAGRAVNNVDQVIVGTPLGTP